LSSTVFGVSHEDVGGILRTAINRTRLELSEPIGVEPRKKVHPESVDVLRSMNGEIPAIEEQISGEEVLNLTRRIMMSSGLVLYNELVANIVSSGNCNLNYRTCVCVMKQEIESPIGFADMCVDAGQLIKRLICHPGVRYQTKIPGRERQLLVVNSRYERFMRYCESIGVEPSENNLIKFIQTMCIIDKITSAASAKKLHERYSSRRFAGDIENAILEAVVFTKPVDVVFTKCARMVQYRDSEGRNRLGIISHVDDEERESFDGRRSYEGDRHLISYLRKLKESLVVCGVEANMVVLIADDDVENMYPDYRRNIVPREDVENVKKECVHYARSLKRAAVVNGADVEVYLITDALSGTEYERIKRIVREDAIRGIHMYSREREFTSAVGSDHERYAKVYIGYCAEDAKNKVGNRIGVLRGLSVIRDHFGTNRGTVPIFLTREVPLTQSYFAVPLGEKKRKSAVLYCDPERDELNF